ncbi:MAG: hypothetical protein ABR520_06880 [Mycobacteriales bacterium]
MPVGDGAARAVVDDVVHGVPPPGVELRRTGRISLGPVPTAFGLRRTAMSHGWCALAPTAYDETNDRLHRTVATPDAGPLTVTVRQLPDGRLEASWGRTAGSRADRAAIREQLRRMLALDDDLTELHEACRAAGDLAWAADLGVGRLFRSPSVFEDLVKTLATTNCSWALTKAMTTRIVETIGAAGPAGERAFPSAVEMAAVGERHFSDVVRAGYRARAFVELAARVASGDLDPERWLDPTIPDAQVLAELKLLRGFGPYAAEGMLGLLGRPRGLALDSWVRAKLPALLGRKSITDRAIARRYARLGRWAGTGLWLELTRDWFA